MTKKRTKAYLALLANSAIWGTAIPLVKLALPFTTAFRWLFYRYLIAAPLSLPIIIHYLRQKKYHRHLGTIIGLELIGTTAVLGILYTALNITSALDATLIVDSGPIFVILGGVLFLGEREDRHEWIGLVIATIGTLMITIEPLLNSFVNGHHSSLLGNVMLIGHNLLWAAYILLAKKLYKKIPKMLVTAISFWVGLVSFGVLSYFSPAGLVLTDLTNLKVLFTAFYMAVPGSIIALTLYLYGQNLIEASEATMFYYLQPLIAIPLSIWLLGDKLTWPIIVGIILLGIGVYLAEIRPRKV